MPASGSSIALMPGGFNHYEQSLRIVDVLENDGQGLNLTWEVRDGIAKHSKGKSGAPVGMPPELRSSTVEGQIMRVADLIAYVNHDIDDATRAGILNAGGSADASGDARSAHSSSARIGTLVKDVVTETLAGGLTEIRMSERDAPGDPRAAGFLFEAVYENTIATAEFKKASGILSGLWEKVRERPAEFLDRKTIDSEGPRRRDPRLHRRHDRPLRGPAVRAALHPEAVGDRLTEAEGSGSV